MINPFNAPAYLDALNERLNPNGSLSLASKHYATDVFPVLVQAMTACAQITSAVNLGELPVIKLEKLFGEKVSAPDSVELLNFINRFQLMDTLETVIPTISAGLGLYFTFEDVDFFPNYSPIYDSSQLASSTRPYNHITGVNIPALHDVQSFTFTGDNFVPNLRLHDNSTDASLSLPSSEKHVIKYFYKHYLEIVNSREYFRSQPVYINSLAVLPVGNNFKTDFSPIVHLPKTFKGGTNAYHVYLIRNGRIIECEDIVSLQDMARVPVLVKPLNGETYCSILSNSSSDTEEITRMVRADGGETSLDSAYLGLILIPFNNIRAEPIFNYSPSTIGSGGGGGGERSFSGANSGYTASGKPSHGWKSRATERQSNSHLAPLIYSIRIATN